MGLVVACRESLIWRMVWGVKVMDMREMGFGVVWGWFSGWGADVRGGGL